MTDLDRYAAVAGALLLLWAVGALALAWPTGRVEAPSAARVRLRRLLRGVMRRG